MVALWFGEGDFDRTAHIIAMAGQDVDCTAAPVLNALAVLHGGACISAKWAQPVGTTIRTYMRRYPTLELDDLVGKTVAAVRSARENRNGI